MKKEEPILVAIWCLVYNHEPYLRDCLEGFVMQETNFRFVAVVHDDCSTDGSARIIQEYTEKYPEIFRPIYETENQYSKHDGSLDRIMMDAVTKTVAKYIAFCEGDDYWTDSLKLQRQVDFIESHPEYVAIAENGLIHNTINDQKYPFNTESSHDISLEEAIIKRRFPTAGVLCRREAMNGYSTTCRISVDTILWCWLISQGKFRYENIISSVYRRGAQGMTEYTEPYQLAKKAEVWNKEILRVFDVKKDFMYAHMAKMFYDCTKSSMKRLHFISAIKCLYYSAVYWLRLLVC